MNKTTGSTTSGASAQQASAGPSDVDPIKPQEDEPSPPSQKLAHCEPEGVLRPDAIQPSLYELHIEVLADLFGKRAMAHLDSKMHVLVCNRSFDPILQRGPCCGMVALAMLARMLGKEEVTTEVIVDHARKRGYTRCGELYSVRNARAIAEDLLKIEATVEGVGDCPWTVCEHLIDHAILFCYDNCENRPCYNRGRSAHWALITGFALVYNENLTPKQQEVFDSYHIDNFRGKGDVDKRSALREALVALRRHSQVPPTVYVFGRQGHCEKTFYFPWRWMVESCLQMKEYADPHVTTNFVLPPEGMAEAMGGKFVKVHVPHEVAAFKVSSHAEDSREVLAGLC